MNDLEWILIDEYQDFSALFFHLISTIQKFNPAVKLFCVGDDWQAINSFAGSDLSFFENFQEFFQDSDLCHLLTNYRCLEKIIVAGNALMENLGKTGMPAPGRTGGSVHICHVDDIRIETKDPEKQEEDKRFLFYEQRAKGIKNNDNGFLQARYLKACYMILTQEDNYKLLRQA